LIAIETLAYLRIAHHFGYGTPSEKLKDIVYSASWSVDIRDESLRQLEEAKRELAMVLAETQL